MTFNKQLLPNYIAGLAIIFVFLGGFGYVMLNIDTFADDIIQEGDATGSAFRASVATAIVTAMIFIVKEVTSYLFRKNPSMPEPE